MKKDFRRDAKVLLFDTECFSGEVEVLTEDGFVRFDQLGDERVAQYEEDGSIEFVKPLRKIERDYIGEGVEFSTSQGKMRVTANHVMVSRARKSGVLRKTAAKEFANGRNDIVFYAGLNKNSKGMKAIDQLAVALQADGCLREKDGSGGWWEVHLKKARKIKRLEKILSKLNRKWSLYSHKDGSVTFRIHAPIRMSKSLKTWFRVADCGEDFLQEIAVWDGSYTKLKGGNRIKYSSCELENIEFVQAVAVCNNRRTSWCLNKKSSPKTWRPCYCLSIGHSYRGCERRIKKKPIALAERVFCVEVPSHMIIVRGGQQTLVVGNCSPTLGWGYGQYEANLIKVEQPPILLAISWKWLGDKGGAKGKTLFDFGQTTRWDDDGLVRKLWKLLDEANIVVAHNLKGFDQKMANGFFLRHNLTPPSPYQTVDTLQVARRYFKLDNNRLDYIGRLLFGEGKTEVTYKDCWDKMLNGSEKEARKYAKLMDKYCRRDTDLLEDVYNKIVPWISNHPNMALSAGVSYICTHCGQDSKFKVKAYRRTGAQINAIQFQCKNCGGYVTRPLNKEEREELASTGELRSIYRNLA